MIVSLLKISPKPQTKDSIERSEAN